MRTESQRRDTAKKGGQGRQRRGTYGQARKSSSGQRSPPVQNRRRQEPSASQFSKNVGSKGWKGTNKRMHRLTQKPVRLILVLLPPVRPGHPSVVNTLLDHPPNERFGGVPSSGLVGLLSTQKVTQPQTRVSKQPQLQEKNKKREIGREGGRGDAQCNSSSPSSGQSAAPSDQSAVGDQGNTASDPGPRRSLWGCRCARRGGSIRGAVR